MKNEYSTNILTDNKNQSWLYIDTKKMQELYPNGGYVIKADLKKGKKEDCVGYLTDEVQQIEVFPYAHNLKANEKCVGFICVSSEDNRDSYIRIVKKSKRGLWFLLMLVSLCFILLGGFFYLSGNNNVPNLDDNAISYHIEGMENKDPSNISIPLFTQIKVDDKTMEAEVHLANPQGNPCYFEYHIVLKEENEDVYQSNLIEPGTAIPKFQLNRKLNKGSYDAMIRIKTFDLNDHTTPMNGGEIDIKLIVE